MEYAKDFRAGFISIVGRPNVGKSTLTNALVGQKVAITSNRPETTRHNVRAVVHLEKGQLVLVDTPGLHRPRTLLGKRLNDMVREALVEVDAVVFCLPADQKIGPGDRFIAQELAELRRPVVAVVTKADLVSSERLAEALIAVNELGDWEAIVPVSAKAQRLGDLTDVLCDLMPLSPPLYPVEQVADDSLEKMIAELVREAALESVRDELPHSLAVQVNEILYEGEDYGPTLGYSTSRAAEETDMNAVRVGKGDIFLEPDKALVIHVNVFVERPSQKGIILGRGGQQIRKIRLRARQQIKRLLGCPVKLELHVSVAKNWQSNPKLLGRLGF